MAVAEAITETVEVGKQDSSLLVGEFDDRVLVERDASTNTVVIRRQQVLQKLIVGCKPLHLHPWSGREVLGTAGIGHHHKVVFRYVVTFFVEHKTTFTSSANKVHTSVAQFGVIHLKEIRSVLKINFHGTKIHFISFTNTRKCEICENSGAFCETCLSGRRCIFASN